MRIMREREESVSDKFDPRLISLLDDQGYTIDDVIDKISTNIAENEDKYFNIYASISAESDSYDEQCESDLKDAITDQILDLQDSILSDEDVDEYDIMDLIDEKFNYDADEIHEINSDYDSNGDSLRRQWRDEQDELERDYWNSRI